MSYTNATHPDTDHSTWLNALDFYKKDLAILESRLAEIASKNFNFDARAGMEHFQNQFIVQRNNIDILSHDIREHSQLAAADAKRHPGHIDKARITEHKKVEDEVKVFEKVMSDLRHEFNGYLSKWM